VVKVIWQKGRIAAAHGRFISDGVNVHAHVSLGPSKFKTERASRSVQPLHGSPQSVPVYFTVCRPFSPQNCPFSSGIWTPIYMFLWVWDHPNHNPNGVSIGSAVFLRGSLLWQTVRQADRQQLL